MYGATGGSFEFVSHLTPSNSVMNPSIDTNMDEAAAVATAAAVVAMDTSGPAIQEQQHIAQQS